MYCWWEGDLTNAFWRALWQHQLKLRGVCLPLVPGISQLGIYQNLAFVFQEACPVVFTTVLFLITRDNPNTQEERLNDIVLLAMKYYTADKKNALHPHEQK